MFFFLKYDSFSLVYWLIKKKIYSSTCLVSWKCSGRKIMIIVSDDARWRHLRVLLHFKSRISWIIRKQSRLDTAIKFRMTSLKKQTGWAICKQTETLSSSENAGAVASLAFCAEPERKNRINFLFLFKLKIKIKMLFSLWVKKSLTRALLFLARCRTGTADGLASLLALPPISALPIKLAKLIMPTARRNWTLIHFSSS